MILRRESDCRNQSFDASIDVGWGFEPFRPRSRKHRQAGSFRVAMGCSGSKASKAAPRAETRPEPVPQEQPTETATETQPETEVQEVQPEQPAVDKEEIDGLMGFRSFQ